jgi:hypothetical protein
VPSHFSLCSVGAGNYVVVPLQTLFVIVKRDRNPKKVKIPLSELAGRYEETANPSYGVDTSNPVPPIVVFPRFAPTVIIIAVPSTQIDQLPGHNPFRNRLARPWSNANHHKVYLDECG